MKNKAFVILPAIVAIFVAFSSYLNYESQKYSSIEQNSMQYVNFAMTYYIATHLFCTPDYHCTYENISFPELQRTELQKYQDQADWTGGAASVYSTWAKSFSFFALAGNLALVYLIYTDTNR